MDFSKALDSEWLKIDINVVNGDHIRFLDAGNEDVKEDGKTDYVFLVGVLKDGELVSQKKFSLNKTNGKATAALFGMDTSKWVGKELRVNRVLNKNPQTGKRVPAIELTAPNIDVEGNVILGK